MILRNLAIGILLMTVIFVAATYTLYSDTNGVRVEQGVTPVIVPPSAKHIKLTEHFRKVGSPCPERMATAVLETSSPRLYAVIVTRESEGDPTAIGDGGASVGATQVKAKHWAHLLHEGRVSQDPVIQLQDTERIINALKKEHRGRLTPALNAYGGSTTGAYAKTILAKVQVMKQNKI